MTDSTASPIPFNQPAITGREFEYMRAAMSGGHLSGDGPFTKRCHDLLRELTGSSSILLTTSCTHALEMAALLLNIQPGDEVICPAFTFVSTVNAFALRGARPVLLDIRSDTLNLDETCLAAAISPRTRAIVVVHYAGVACAMDKILPLAKQHGIPVVEDNAHGLFAKYQGQPLGTFGQLSTLSFHETKNITCGEGGALAINDPALVAAAEIIREKGTDRSRYFRGQVDRYTWVSLGSSYLPSDLLAAYLLAQLESHAEIQARRHHLWQRYQSALAGWAASLGIGLPHIPDDVEQPAHMFYLMMPSLEARTSLIAHMRARGVLLVFHYQPLHLSEMGRRWGGRPGQLPVTERVADRLVRLPLYYQLRDDQQQTIIAALTEWLPSSR